MKKQLIILVCLITLPVIAQSQQPGRGMPEIVSPEINQDHTVTFRLIAPNAKEVMISGDWMPSQGWSPGSTAMVRDEKGTWTFTSGVLPSELYSYFFLVDGLRCMDPNNVYMIRDVATVTNIFLVGGGQADLYAVNDVPHGTVARRWYDSPGTDKVRRITVYTPPGYEKGNDKYPVLYLLHGMGGDEEAWLTLGRTAQILDNLIARGKALPMIVVMPNGNVAQEAAPGESDAGLYKPSFQVPNTMDGKMEETFPDIIRFTENNYRVQKNKAGRAIAGLSMGGYHTLHISRYYPGTFDYIGLFSAAIMPNEKADSKVYADLDATLARQKANGYKLYWIGIGKTDFLYKAVSDYRTKLDRMGMPYQYRESEGGHTWANWRIYLSELVQLLFN